MVHELYVNQNKLLTIWSAQHCPWNFLETNFEKKFHLKNNLKLFFPKFWRHFFPRIFYPLGYSKVPSKNVNPFGPAVWPAIADIYTNKLIWANWALLYRFNPKKIAIYNSIQIVKKTSNFNMIALFFVKICKYLSIQDQY